MTATVQAESSEVLVTEIIELLLQQWLRRLAHVTTDLTDTTGTAVLAFSLSVEHATVTAHLSSSPERAPRAPWQPVTGSSTDYCTQLDENIPFGDRGDTAQLVIVGVTTDNYILVLNLHPAATIAIHGPNTVPIARSWILQLLATSDHNLITDNPDLLPLGKPLPPRLTSTDDTSPQESGADIAFLNTAEVITHRAPTTIDTRPAGNDSAVMIFAPGNRSAEVELQGHGLTFMIWRMHDTADRLWDTLASTITTTPDPEPIDLPHAWVSVLGPITVATPSGITSTALNGSNRPDRDTELVTALALAGQRGLPASEVVSIVWPDATGETAATKAKRPLTEHLNGVRKAYGANTDDERIVVAGRTDGNVTAMNTVTTDWDLFQQLLPTGPKTADTDHLAAAVGLIRGAPFADAPAGRYTWAKHLIDLMLDATADAALELADRHRRAGRTDLAHTAAMAGIQANPQRQDLWRLALTTAPDPNAQYDLAREVSSTIVPRDMDAATRRLVTSLTKSK